jgi:hypothetical protein
MSLIQKVSTSAKPTKKLQAYATEINSLLRSTLESVVRIGEILKDVRDNVLPYGEWLEWVDREFHNSITTDTAANFINLYDLHTKYSGEYPKGLETLSLSSLYIIGRHNVDEEVQKAVLELAEEEQQPPSREQVRSIVRTYRQIKLEESGLAEPIQAHLVDMDIAENASEVKAISRLSKKKQGEVVQLLSAGEAKTTKEAIRLIRSEKEKIENVKSTELVEVDYTELVDTKVRNWEEIPGESVNLALVEAPFRSQYVETEMHKMCIELDRVLVPGGYAIITVGHKGAMFVGNEIDPLKAVHLLCLRRRPGNSKAIVGTNIMSASVFAVFAYKPPYAAPKRMLVDLHTYTDITETEALAGMDEVHNGIEESIKQLCTPLLHNGETMLHAVLSPLNFSITDHVRDVSKELGARQLYRYKA